MNENNENELGYCIQTFIENARKRKYMFPNSKEVLENVSNIYMMDTRSHENMASIAGKYIISSYSLEYLKRLNKLIEEKYSIKQLSLLDFENETKIEEIKKEIKDVENEPFMVWLKDVCLEDLRQMCENIDIKDTGSLNKLGHIINLTLNELKNEETNDVDLYDAHYKFQTRLENFNMKNNSITTFYLYIGEENKEIRVEHKKRIEYKINENCSQNIDRLTKSKSSPPKFSRITYEFNRKIEN